jgi:hypothetical protein
MGRARRSTPASGRPAEPTLTHAVREEQAGDGWRDCCSVTDGGVRQPGRRAAAARPLRDPVLPRPRRVLAEERSRRRSGLVLTPGVARARARALPRPRHLSIDVIAPSEPAGHGRGVAPGSQRGRWVKQVARVLIGDMRVAIADHLGWAVAVTASADYEVVDRRRIELIQPGVSAAPIHYESRRLDVAATAALVAKVRASVARATSAALDELATALPAPVLSISLRAWPLDFPDDIAVQRRAPYEARADAIMYRQELSELAHARGWEVHLYDAKAVVDQAVRMLAERADEVLHGPRATIGPPWTKDHRIALAATILAG